MLQPSIPILMYHRVSPLRVAGLDAMTVSPRAFDRQLRLIREEGFTPVTMGEVAASLRGSSAPTGLGAKPLPTKPLAITFDDGFADFCEHAMPCLTAHGCSATLFLTTGFVGGRSAWLQGPAGELPMLTWETVAEVDRAGIEIGGHTMTHPALDALPPDRAMSEIRRSKTVIEDRLGRAVRSFAYPFGYYDRRVRSLVAQAGFETACAVRYGLSGAGDDPLALRRYHVEEDFGLRELRAFAAGQTPSWPVLYQRTRHRTWGVARRGVRMLRGAWA
jgi:peptidoglycan/xylan/chitin deacetylase (PgdA/CDA1 family)